MKLQRKSMKRRGMTDWDKVAKISEKDIVAAAKSDPDSVSLSLTELKQFKRVKSPETINVKKIRRRLKLSQKEFAYYFGVSARTIQEWEQARRSPSTTARNFLRVIEREPQAVQRALSSKQKLKDE